MPLGLGEEVVNFGIADAAVLHDGLLTHFFDNNTVGNLAAHGFIRFFCLCRILGQYRVNLGFAGLDFFAFARLDNQRLIDKLA